MDSESVRVYSDGPEDSASRSLARYIARVAALYVPSHRVRLMARPDRFARGSDHTSFSDRGYPAVAFREANENFAKQHSALDTVDGVDFAYLAQNARVNVVSLAALALAPPAPVVTNQRGQADDRTAALGLRRQPAVACRRRALLRIESTGASLVERLARVASGWRCRRSSLCRAFPSTTTSSAWRLSAQTVTKASSALTSSDVRNADL